jgi:hypothetical protein
MAQDVRPYRSGAFALFLVAAAILALGVWAQLNPGSADPATRLVTDRLLPLLDNSLSAVLGPKQTTFGTLANLAGAIAIAGLLLLTLRGRTPAPDNAPAALPALPRVVPRRPSDLRAGRPASATTPATATDAADRPSLPALAPTRKRTGITFHRAALMLIGSVLTGLSGALFYSQAQLPVPAFTPPAALGDPGTRALLEPALLALGGALALFAILRTLRRRRTAS